jgi:N-formylglutamate amidohydrolase
LPVLLSIPHSGRDYPRWLLSLSSAGREALESLADPYVDRLAWRAINAGHGAVVARAPRAAIDCNRAPEDIEPGQVVGPYASRPTTRSRAGLGLVADRTSRFGKLWSRPIGRLDLERRVLEAHNPYHRAIETGLDALTIASGTALLLDCHSMPARRGQAELVIGDRHGRSASAWITAEAARIARAAGWRVAINHPYAGGYVVERHGQPQADCHALQLEFCRDTYLDPRTGEPGSGFDRASLLLASIADGLGRKLSTPFAIAAE